MHRYLIIVLLASIAIIAGCRPPQTVKNAWKDTRYYYATYVNTPATLDLEDAGSAAEYERDLGMAIADFDMQIRALERVLQNSDLNPDPVWVNKVTTRFPWLSGLALTDPDGEPRAQISSDYAKPFGIGTLNESDAKQQLKDLRACVQDDPLGPEIYIGNPVYAGSDFKGLIVVHFDPRTLLARMGDPGKIIIASPQGILWPGMFAAESTPISAINWGEVVKDSSYGTVSNEHGTFYWVARYIGNLPLIYAVKVKGDFPLNEDNLSALAQADSYAMGPVSLGRNQGAPRPQARPMTSDLDGLAEGEVGNIGSPNVAPDAPYSGTPVPHAPAAKADPLDQ